MPRRHTVSSDDLRALASLVDDGKNPTIDRTIRLAVRSINAFQTDLDDADRVCARLRAQRDKLHTSNAVLERKREALQEEIDELKTTNRRLLGEREADQRKYRELETDTSHARQKLCDAVDLPNASWEDSIARAAEFTKAHKEAASLIKRATDSAVRAQEYAYKRIADSEEKRDSAITETALVKQQKLDAMKLIQQFHDIWTALLTAWKGCLNKESEEFKSAVRYVWKRLCRQCWSLDKDPDNQYGSKNAAGIISIVLRGSMTQVHEGLESAVKKVFDMACSLREDICNSQFTVHIDPEATQLDSKVFLPPLVVVSLEHFGDGWEGRVASKIPETWMSLRGTNFVVKNPVVGSFDV